MERERKIRLSFNSPVVLVFTFLCLAVLGLDFITSGKSTVLLFSVYRSSFANPLTYIRMFTHVLGHANWGHLFGNISMLLIVGPLLEEKYGSSNTLFVMLATALVTGLANFFFFPNVRLLGASGIVFAFILLSSITSFKENTIPLTFILVALVYIGKELYSAFFVDDNISNLAHLLGGFMGSLLGFILNKNKMFRTTNRVSDSV